MGLFSAITDSWKEASYEVENQFRRLGCVLRIKVDSGYRYGIYCGKGKIAVARGFRVRQESYSKFRDGEGFFNAGYAQAMLFSTSRTTGESLKVALGLIGRDTDMTNRQFAMFCRTGDMMFDDDDASKPFSLSALKEMRCEDSHQVAIKQRDKVRSEAIISALQSYRKPLLRTVAAELRSELPKDLFTVKLQSGKGISVSSNAGGQIQSLSKALRILTPDVVQPPSDLSVSTSLKSDKTIVKQILAAAEKKHGKACGVHKGVCYLPEKDKFFADFDNKVNMEQG